MATNRLSRRAALTRLGIGVGVLAVTACGFHPVHGRRGSGEALRSVSVAHIEEREGQLLRNALLDRLRPAQDAPHELKVTLRVYDQNLGISANSNPTLNNLFATARWQLLTRDGEGRQSQETTGYTRFGVTYNILSNQYATEVNRRAARDAVVEEIAAHIETQLVAYFENNGAARSSGPVAYPGF